MRKGYLALLGMSLHLSLAISASACISTSQEIVWADRAKGQVMFIPGDLLNETDWSKLPLDEVSIQTLEGAIQLPERLEERKRTLGREESPCTKHPQPIANEPLPTAKPLSAYLDTLPLSLVGVVESVAPGWSIREGEAAQAVYVKVENVLRHKGVSPKKGTVIVYLARHGSFHLRGTRICRYPQPGFQEPREGAQVLLMGEISSTNSKLFYPGFVYPIENGKIQYQPYLDVQKFDAIDFYSWLERFSNKAENQ